MAEVTFDSLLDLVSRSAPDYLAHSSFKSIPFGDPAAIRPRAALLSPHVTREFLGATIGPGGRGKSTLVVTEAIAVATGMPLLGILPSQRARVMYINGEDPSDEVMRRIAAICQHHQITRRELEGWLFVDAAWGRRLNLATQAGREVTIDEKLRLDLIEFIRAKNIAWVIFDPLKAFHAADENDNGAMEVIANFANGVARETGCAIEFVHHSRKTSGRDVGADDSRGGGALINSARSVRVINRMSDSEAQRYGIDPGVSWSYMRVESVKSNLTANDHRQWFRLVSVVLPNGDNVQAAAPWSPPDFDQPLSQADVCAFQTLITAGRNNGEGWRLDAQTGDAWVGLALAEVLSVDVSEPGVVRRLKSALGYLLDEGYIVQVSRPTGTRGKKAPFAVIGRKPDGL